MEEERWWYEALTNPQQDLEDLHWHKVVNVKVMRFSINYYLNAGRTKAELFSHHG